MFFKQPPEVGKLTHIIISAHGRAGANTGADIWKGGGLRQRQKTSGPFLKRPWSFKKRPWSFSERTRTSGPEKKGPATYVSGEFRARPEASHKIPTTEFCKTAATATTQPPETAMGRAFQGVVAPHFFRREKGMLPPLLTLFYPKTTAGEGKYIRKRGRKRTEKDRDAEGQNTGNRRKGSRLQPARTLVSYGQTHSYSPVELKFQPHGTGWNS